jgi:uncharacterized membrane protein
MERWKKLMNLEARSSRIVLMFIMFCLVFSFRVYAFGPVTVNDKIYDFAYLLTLGYGGGRPTFYDGSRFWIFFSNNTDGTWGGAVLYSSSSDGISWSEPAILRADADTHYRVSVWFENFTTNKTVYVSMSQFTTAADLRFRRGNITGSAIEWEPERIISVSNYVRGTFVTLNSTKYPWIGFCMWDGEKYRPWVVAANALDGSSWGTPILLSDEGCAYPSGPTLLPLSSGKMYAIWFNLTFRGMFYNGTNWINLTTIDDSALYSGFQGQYAAVVNDRIYLVFTGSDGRVYVRNWTETQGWGERIVIDDNTDNSANTTITAGSDGSLYVFWVRNNVIYYKKYIPALGWDSAPSTPFGTSFNGPTMLKSSQEATNFVVSVAWLENTSVEPYPIRFGFLDVGSPQWSYNSTNSTLAGSAVSHNLYWQDNIGLSYAVFYFDNCTGNLAKAGEMSLSGTSAWTNFTVVINSTVGCMIRWCVYVNDTSGNTNGTCENPFTYITSSLSSTLELNATKVWWNDSVLARGYMTRNGQPANGTLNLLINNQVYCSNVQIINGNWNCTFYAPLEIKTYTVTINYTDDLGNPGSNSTTLTVSPFYGKAPTRGFISILEQYVMIQDLNGKIKRVKLSLAVWR